MSNNPNQPREPYRGETPAREQPPGQQPGSGQEPGRQAGTRGQPTQQPQGIQPGQPTQQPQVTPPGQSPSAEQRGALPQGGIANQPPANRQQRRISGQPTQQAASAQPQVQPTPQGGQTPPAVGTQPTQPAGIGPQSAPPQGASQPVGQQGMEQQVRQQAGPGLKQRGGVAGGQFSPVPVEEVIRTDVVTANATTPVSSVTELMADEQVGSVVVVDDEGRPQGIVTDRKIALALSEASNVAATEIGELVGSDLVTGRVDMDLFEAIELLREREIRRLPIVDEDGVLEGIVTLDDILVTLTTELSDVATVIQAQSPRF